MPQDQTGANKLPLDVERREREESGRRAGRLIQLYLQHTSRLPRLAAHPANDVIDTQPTTLSMAASRSMIG